jgi:hypothetical protein
MFRHWCILKTKSAIQSDDYMYKQRTFQRKVFTNTNFKAHSSKEDTFTNALGIPKAGKSYSFQKDLEAAAKLRIYLIVSHMEKGNSLLFKFGPQLRGLSTIPSSIIVVE